MKTAISIPDATFDRASARARDLGMSRSEFFTTAALHFLDELDAQSTTRQLDDALARLEGVDVSSSDAVGHGHRTLTAYDDNAW